MKEDLEKEVEAKKVAEASTEATPEVYQGITVKSTMPFTGMRKTIAEYMRRSLSVSALVTVMGEIDMTEMVNLAANPLPVSEHQILELLKEFY